MSLYLKAGTGGRTSRGRKEGDVWMMCGIDEAVRVIRIADQTYGIPQANLIISRLEYHRAQAEGVKPKYYRGDSPMHSYYTCRNCGAMVKINDNYCANCGYRILWDSCRCLTGLPLVDAAERAKETEGKE